MLFNCEKVKGMTQEKNRKSSPVFYRQLVEAFRKYTNIDPSTFKGQSLLGQQFLSASLPLMLLICGNFKS